VPIAAMLGRSDPDPVHTAVVERDPAREVFAQLARDEEVIAHEPERDLGTGPGAALADPGPGERGRRRRHQSGRALRRNQSITGATIALSGWRAPMM